MKRFIKGSMSIMVVMYVLTFTPIEAAAERTMKRCCIVITKADYPLSAVTIGPSPVATSKKGILQEATKFVQAEGFDVTLDTWFSTQTFENYRRTFALAYAMGTAPDILSEDQDILPEYAEKGKLLPLDTYVKADEWKANFTDFPSDLWDAVSWNGQIYGVPIEQVVHCLYYRKDVLKNLGMSYAEIDKLFSPEKQEFTLERLIELARKAKDVGLVEWGFTHPPDNADYWIDTVMMFDGEVVDNATGNMVVDTEALRKDFAFHKRLVDEGLLPADITQWDWKKIHKYTVEGKTLFWLGGHSGQWREYQREAYHDTLGTLSEDDLQINMGIAPFPGITEPITPIKVHAYTIVSTTKHPDIAFNIITKAVTPQYIAWHSMVTYNGPTRTSATEIKRFQEKRYLARVLDVMRYAQAFPKHLALDTYKSMIFEAIAGIETGQFTVEEALEFVVSRAKSNIPGVIIIRKRR
jgi:maltose-binding protein MalE